jgi:microcystin-dependent protein
MEGYIAVVTHFAADFAPRGWAFCNGQTLPIAQNQALFSLLGTTFGGNGQTTFQLPDFRGRSAVGAGAAPALGTYSLGQPGGVENVPLTAANLPQHSHTGALSIQLDANSEEGSVPRAAAMYPAPAEEGYAATPNGNMAAPAYQLTIQNAGGNVPLPVRSPYLGMNYIICLQGIFPSRN